VWCGRTIYITVDPKWIKKGVAPSKNPSEWRTYHNTTSSLKYKKRRIRRGKKSRIRGDEEEEIKKERRNKENNKKKRSKSYTKKKRKNRKKLEHMVAPVNFDPKILPKGSAKLRWVRQGQGTVERKKPWIWAAQVW
jgi:hypothetical protein